MDQLKIILDTFGFEYHNCKFEGKPLPELAIVCSENNYEEAKNSFLVLPTVGFKVSIITGRKYCEKAYPHVKDDDFNDEIGNLYLQEAGGAAYNANDRTVYVLYPYPTNNGFPLERSIIHEMGHYKQDVLHGAIVSDNRENNIILEYHNIMVNENRSGTTICGCGTCHGQRVCYNIKENYSEKITKETLIAKKSNLEECISEIIKQYPTRSKLLDDMQKVLNNSQDNQHNELEINLRLIFNMLKDLKYLNPKWDK